MSDWRKYDAVFLDSVWQTEESILDLPTPSAKWKRQLYQFLLDWFDPRVDFILQRTSGSTGEPKKIAIPKQSMINSALMTGKFFELKTEDQALLCLSTEFIGGKMMVIRAMVWGMNLICLEPGNQCLDQLQHLGSIEFAAMVPSQLYHQYEHPKFEQIQTLIIGGAPVTSELNEKIQTLHTEIYATYGMTETVSHIALQKLNGKDRSDHFRTLPQVAIKTNEQECLHISAPHLSEDAIQTNDVVRIHNKTEFEYLGRIDNVINSGGIKIHPEKIEDQLASIIDGNFAISAVSDSVLGEKAVLVLERADKPSDEESQALIAASKEILESALTPKAILANPNFPRTQNGKLQRTILRQLIDNQ